MSQGADYVFKERKYMNFKQKTDDGGKYHWERNLLFFSIALIAIGNKIEMQNQDENKSWD